MLCRYALPSASYHGAMEPDLDEEAIQLVQAHGLFCRRSLLIFDSFEILVSHCVDFATEVERTDDG